MPNQLRPINVSLIKDNTFKLIGADWMLITSGNINQHNTMTASWGAFGELWHKKVCFCFVRPTRYTYKFIEESDTFTLCFFDNSYRDVLTYCGTKSGRDVNKVADMGLTPVEGEMGSVHFSQARLVIECRKVYIHDLDPDDFLDPAVHDEYPQKDYHRMYIGEVLRCLSV